MTGMNKAVKIIHTDTLMNAIKRDKFKSLRPAFSLSMPSGFAPNWITFTMEDIGRWARYCNKVTNKTTERSAKEIAIQKPAVRVARHSSKIASGVKKFKITIMILPEKLAI